MTAEQIATIREALEAGRANDHMHQMAKTSNTTYPTRLLYDKALAILERAEQTSKPEQCRECPDNSNCAVGHMYAICQKSESGASVNKRFSLEWQHPEPSDSGAAFLHNAEVWAGTELRNDEARRKVAHKIAQGDSGLGEADDTVYASPCNACGNAKRHNQSCQVMRERRALLAARKPESADPAKDARELAGRITTICTGWLSPFVGKEVAIVTEVTAEIERFAKARDARNPEPEPAKDALWDAFEAGYMQGHNDTVESCVRDSKEAAMDYFESAK